MVRACLLLLAGGIAAQHCRVPLGSDPAKLLIVASVLLIARAKTRSLGCLLLGFALFMQAGQSIVDARLDSRYAGDSMLTRVRIVDFPRSSGKSVIMRVAPLDDPRLPRMSRLSWFDPHIAPAIGDLWQFEVRLRRPRGASNPGVFDFEGWLFREGVHATGYVVTGKRTRLIATGRGSRLDALRADYVRRVASAAESAEAAAVLAAVGVGARHLVTREQWHRYALTGTSHLMAISGLHVGLAATAAFGLCVAVFGFMRLSANAHVAAILAGVLAAMLYAIVSGLGVPAQRAALMLVLASIAMARRRLPDPYKTLAVAAIAVYAADPVAIMAPGFALSFAAVAMLFWAAHHRHFPRTAANRSQRVLRPARRLLGVQLCLLFGLMPLTVLFFGRAAFLALPANLVALPVFSIVTVPLALAGLAVGGLWEPAAQFLLQAAAVSVDWVDAGLSTLERLPIADTTVAILRGPMQFAIVLPALWAMLPRGWPGRWLAVVAATALISYTPAPPPESCAEAHVLDVGQGLAVVVRTQRGTLLFDTGIAYRGGGDAAAQVIVPFLRGLGIRRVDWLLVSHADVDHRGGLPTIMAYADVGVLLAGEPDALPVGDARACRSGQRWHADGVAFRILHPPGNDHHSGNDASCVLLVAAGRHSLLVTGDIEGRAEHELLRRDAVGTVDAVLVPHHGSLTSSSPPFVKRLSPRLAIVSAAHSNRWGLPREAVVERWRAAGATVMNTATDGAVSLTLCGAGGISDVRGDRHERRRFWRRAGD